MREMLQPFLLVVDRGKLIERLDVEARCAVDMVLFMQCRTFHQRRKYLCAARDDSGIRRQQVIARRPGGNPRVEQLLRRSHVNEAAVALANKMARNETYCPARPV